MGSSDRGTRHPSSNPSRPTRPISRNRSRSRSPGQQVTGPHPKNSGGVTRDAEVTVVGRTTPNSIIFTDGSPQYPPKKTFPPGAYISGAYKFLGQALASDSDGYFSYKVKLSGALTQTEYLIKDPFGHQRVIAFPIRMLSP